MGFLNGVDGGFLLKYSTLEVDKIARVIKQLRFLKIYEFIITVAADCMFVLTIYY